MQQVLRQTFERWGLPDYARFDNGIPWGNPDHWELPRDFALWLTGLQVGVIYNDPHCPKENGVVERDHGVVQGWVEPGSCANLGQLRQRLDKAVRIQRECYELRPGKSRLQLFAQLGHKRRVYLQDSQQWQIEPVEQWLSRGVWYRRVDINGKISVYSWFYNVGRRWSHQQVALRYDAQTHSWLISDEKGNQLAHHLALGITPQQIMQLRISRPRPPRSNSSDRRGQTSCDIQGAKPTKT